MWKFWEAHITFRVVQVQAGHMCNPSSEHLLWCYVLDALLASPYFWPCQDISDDTVSGGLGQDHPPIWWLTRTQDLAYSLCTLWLLRVKGYKANEQREKACGVKSGGNQAPASTSPLLVKSQSIHLKAETPHVKCCPQGSSLETQRPGYLLGAGQVLNIQTSEGKQVFNKHYTLGTNSPGTLSHSYHLGNGRKPSKIQVPRQQPTLQTGLSMASSLKPGMLTFLQRYHLYKIVEHDIQHYIV